MQNIKNGHGKLDASEARKAEMHLENRNICLKQNRFLEAIANDINSVENLECETLI